jgi:hypothetical protein
MKDLFIRVIKIARSSMGDTIMNRRTLIGAAWRAAGVRIRVDQLVQ